jgi:nitrate reductase NapAB chaperone NapD
MRVAAVAFLALAHTLAALAACPNSAPGANIGIETFCPDLKYADAACPNGPVSFGVATYGSGGFPPAPYIPPYQIQPCDSVTWAFGDGTTQTVVGSVRVTHNFPSPGNYVVRVTLTNDLGSTTAKMSTSRVIASSPSRLSFVTGGISACPNCVVARENDGSVTIVVDRSLDLSRTVTAVAHVDALGNVPGIANVAVPLTFAPGETRQTFSAPITNDDKFYGPRYYYLWLADESGGTFTFANTPWQPKLYLIEDDPPPVLSIATPTIAIREGDSGSSLVLLRAELSTSMLLDATANAFYRPSTADWDDFTAGDSPRILPGATTAMFAAGEIRGDTRVEPDEQYLVHIAPRSTINDPSFGVTDAIVTILNDDAAFVPERLSITTGTTAKLKLDIGSPYAAPTMITFTSSNESAIKKPLPLLMPAGVHEIELTVVGGNAGNAFIRASAPDRTTQPAVVLVTTPPKRRSTRH